MEKVELKSNKKEDLKIFENFKSNLLAQLSNLPLEKQESEIIKILKNEYGIDVAKNKIENDQEILNQIALKIEKRLAKIEESKKLAELEKILREEYGVSIKIIEELKKDSIWSNKIVQYSTIIAILGLALAGKNLSEYNTENVQEGREINLGNENTTNETVYKIPKPNFNQEVYNSLPDEGKDIYKYYAEYNPTPGKGYAFLDKKNANLYIFDRENNMLNTIVAGFGTDEGDEKNSSVEYQKGIRTTPAGVYIISNLSRPEDLAEYGENQFSLFGISTLGNKEFLGLHQTYEKNNEKARRTRRLATENPEDNKFSDGCINISQEDFITNFKNQFEGAGDELLFVLPDKKKAAEFEVTKLINQIKPARESMRASLEEYNNQKEKTYTSI